MSALVWSQPVTAGIYRAERTDMTLPRQVLPGRFYMSTRRCAQGQFFLRPDEETNNAFAYCLAEAAERCRIELIVAQQMSNHYHAVLYDRYGNIIDFIARFHKLLANCQNALRGRWENMWSIASPSLVELVEPSDVVEHIVYAATNPVLGNLVDRVDHWPGAKMVRAFLAQTPLVARRPSFFRDGGVMPREVALRFSVPAELGDTAEVVRAVREGISATESQQAQKRTVTGTRVLGRKSVLSQSWKSVPTRDVPRRTLSPRVAAKNVTARVAWLGDQKTFQRDHRRARLSPRDAPIPFPLGTYWMARFTNAPVVIFEYRPYLDRDPVPLATGKVAGGSPITSREENRPSHPVRRG